MRRQVAAAALIGLVGLSGCARFGAPGTGSGSVGASNAADTPAPTPIVDIDSSILVITGFRDHTAVTEPLRQVGQPAGADDAEVTVAFTHERLLGTEGAVMFLSATDAAKQVVLDKVIDRGGGTVRMTPGDYRLLAYYRTCDANCGFLDPPTDFCSADATLVPNGRYRLTVNITASTCRLE